jgi:hypothetical protein
VEQQGTAGLSATHACCGALIASSYLAGTNTRRVSRALAALFGGAVGKDTVSRVWRKTKTEWDAWNTRSLTDEPFVRLILAAPWCACGSTAKRLPLTVSSDVLVRDCVIAAERLQDFEDTLLLGFARHHNSSRDFSAPQNVLPH